MVRAAKLFRATLRLGNHGGGMMAADIVKGPQLAIFAADNDERFTCQIGREKLAIVAHLIRAAHDLPRRAEDARALQFRDAGIEIPWRRNRPSFFERVVRIVKIH